MDQQEIIEEEWQQKKNRSKAAALIAKLQENQEAIIEKPNDQEAAWLRSVLKPPKQQVAGATLQAPATAAAAQPQPTIVDPNAGLEN